MLHTKQTFALFQHAELLAAWTLRIIRARYQQSLLGGAWAILQPAATVAVLTTVFAFIVRVDTGGVPYVIFAYVAMVPWLFFSSSLTEMVESIVSNINLVGKIYFPREILTLSVLLARLLDFTIAYSLLIVLMLYYGLPIFGASWLYVPMILTVQFALSLGVGLAGAAINVFYRDVKHLFTLLLQLWFYATPIIYPASLVPASLRPWFHLNPMAGVIEAYRDVIIHGTAPGTYFGLSAAIAFVMLVLGFWLFKRVEHKFADVV